MNSLPTSVRIGTRGSELALWQARHVAARIQRLDIATEIIVIKTRGDLDQSTPVSQIGSKSIFIKELEDALLARHIDLAVHSLKDLPVELPPGLVLAAVPERDSPLDAWICPEGLSLENAPDSMVVACGSLRRSAQLLALRPDLQIVPIRGNVPTRLEKLRRGEARATLLAMAGLRRLGLQAHATQLLSADQMTPAMGQGALALESRADHLTDLFAALDDPLAHAAVRAERRFLAIVGGGCRTPIGIFAQPAGPRWTLFAVLASADGRSILRRRLELPADQDPGLAAENLAVTMLAEASPQILETLERTS